ncbi:class I SAM-dependent methyltransferase [Selenomonas sp. AB3002]|uniref:class I SAM-dependent methyltransferase n=1 Tax=Selenomonas sp. AB3002 TaxID=1392502 RepID=UPI00068C456C
MPEKIEPELLYFLQPSALPVTILVVESVSYLPKLREMFPSARLLAVADEEDALDELPSGLDVEFHCMDYLSERLPFPLQSLDYIISDLTLERAGNPQDIAAGFSTYLKETGAFLTSFRNIRHWSVLEELRDGHYYQVVSRLFARPEFERLLYASFYKNVHCHGQKRQAPAGVLEGLLAAGFENVGDDLETEYWLVRADRSMPEMALLKSMYTAEDRKQLSRLLHRIEYEVELTESCREFWDLWQELKLFSDYAGEFIHEAVFHPEAFFANLRFGSETLGDKVEERLELIGEMEAWER